MLRPEESRAVLTIALLAAFADDTQADSERREVRRAAGALAAELNVPDLYQQILMNRVDMHTAAAQLGLNESRLAFEVAVGVCDADDLRNGVETRFLAQLGAALELGQPEIASIAAATDALVTMPLSATSTRTVPAAPVMAASALVDGLTVDAMILRAAITNGALDLFPQPLASTATIPMQMKLIYRIGKAHGCELDREHIKDLLTTAGIGLTGQYLERIGSKLIGGVLGNAPPGSIGSLTRGATGAALSFATTYAIGQLAKTYFAGGLAVNADLLKKAYSGSLEQGRALQTRYFAEIEQPARSIDSDNLMKFVLDS